MEQNVATDGSGELGIVSVNHRAGALGHRAAKLGFLVVVGLVLMIGLLMALNKWTAHRTAEAEKEEHAAKVSASVSTLIGISTDAPRRIVGSLSLFSAMNVRYTRYWFVCKSDCFVVADFVLVVRVNLCHVTVGE